MSNFNYPKTLAGLWLIAFVFSLPLIEPYSLARLMSIVSVSAALCISMGYLFSTSNTKIIEIRIIPIILILFTLLAGLSLIWTSALNISVIWLCSFLLLPAFFLCFISSSLSTSFYRVTILGMSIIIGALSLWAIIQYVFFPELMIKGRIGHPFANPNSYAALLMLAFFPLFALSFSSKGIGKISLRLLCAVISISLVFLAGRAVLIVFLIFLFLLLFLTRKQVINEKKYIFLLAVCIFVGFTSPNIIQKNNYMNVTERFSTTINNPQRSIETRTSIWKGAIDVVKERPFLGNGFGTFYLHYPKNRDKEEIYSSGLMAHNDALQFWAEIGFLGPLLFYSLCLVCLYYTTKVIKITKDNHKDRMLPVSLSLGLGAVIVHSHVSFNLYVASILCLMSFIFFLWYKEMKHLVFMRPIFVVPIKKLRVATAYSLAFVPAFLIVFFSQGFLLSEYYVSEAKELASGENGEERMIKSINLAHNASLNGNAYAYIISASINISAIENPEIYLNAEEKYKKYNETIDLLNKAEALNKNLVLINYSRGRLYQAMGQTKEFLSEEAFKDALKIDPLHFPSRMKLALFYIQQEKRRKGYEVLKEGLNWSGVSYAPKDYYGLIILLSLEFGELDIHEKSTKILQQVLSDKR